MLWRSVVSVVAGFEKLKVAIVKSNRDLVEASPAEYVPIVE